MQLVREKELALEHAALCKYELRLAREDIKNLHEKSATQFDVSADLLKSGTQIYFCVAPQRFAPTLILRL